MSPCRFCASLVFHKNLHLFTTHDERLLFGEMLLLAIKNGETSLAFPEDGQLVSGAAFYIEFSISDLDGMVRISCNQQAMLNPTHGEWQSL